MAEPLTPPLDELLRERFDIPAFHAWQREAIEALLAPGGRVLLVAPTGGGKSLCYQLPALALPGTTLVLSPLISLMEDQVRALEARRIPATFVASSLPREENGRRLAGLRRGEYKIVYAAPERLVHDGFVDALQASQPALVAIDEAHCIVQWGHDFRPDYLRIGAMLARLSKGGVGPRVVACTATATPDARDEILRQLRLEGATVVLRGFARPNLHLGVEEVSGPRDAHAETAAALRRTLGEARAPGGAGIVYAATRRGAERLATDLAAQGWDARPYHAGQAPDVRAKLSADFAARTVSVVVATNAFGMGIDRPDVRVVVHAQPPASIEAYYQEVGRAGRDGAPAEGLLLVASQDIALRRRLCALGADGGAAAAADAARAWRLFRELLRYVDAATCRHDFILRYFGDEAESLGGCGHCDVCRSVEATASSDPALIARDADVIRRVLAGVARAKGGAGMQAVAQMLRGDRSGRVEHLGLDRLSTFGILEGRSQEDVMVVLRVALAAGWIDLTASEFPVPVMTEVGWRMMRGDLEVRMRLPAAKTRVPRAGKRSRRAVTPGSAVPHDATLYEALRSHRARLAAQSGVPAYVIATDRTLEEIAARRPRNEAELLGVHGMGPARAAKYGEGLLRVVTEQAR